MAVMREVPGSTQKATGQSFTVDWVDQQDFLNTVGVNNTAGWGFDVTEGLGSVTPNATTVVAVFGYIPTVSGDMVVTANLMLPEADDISCIIFGRMLSFTTPPGINYYGLRLITAADKIRLIKTVDGTITNLDTDDTIVYGDGDEIEVTLTIKGTSISASVVQNAMNTFNLGPVTDSDVPGLQGGLAGGRVGPTTSGAVWLRDMTVDPA